MVCQQSVKIQMSANSDPNKCRQNYQNDMKTSAFCHSLNLFFQLFHNLLFHFPRPSHGDYNNSINVNKREIMSAHK